MVSRLTLAILLVHGSWALGAPLTLPPSPAESKCQGTAQPEAIFAEQLLRVCDQVERDYIREVDYKHLLLTAMTGLYQTARLPVPERLGADLDRALAPRTVIVMAKKGRGLLELGQEGGFGIETEEHRGGAAVTVRTVVPDSPAQRTGLRHGDRITHLDGQPVRQLLDKQVFLKLNPMLGSDCVVRTLTSLPALEVTFHREQELFDLLCRLRQEAGNPETLGGRPALVVCCQALAKALDPHTAVVTAEERRKTVGLGEEGFGVGLETEEHRGGAVLVVKTVYPGSPAQQANLRPGDRITHLDGRPVRLMLEEQVCLKLNPQVNSTDTLVGLPAPLPAVEVTFHRPGVERKTIVSLLPQRYQVEHVLGAQRQDNQGWSYWLDAREKLAHVRLGALGQGCSRQLREVLTRLEEEGARGLVLDLRWCPGGYMDEAVEVARLFLKEGMIARIKRRTGKERERLYACLQPGPFLETPLVILVNAETSGGGELISAALQDHKRAVVCGQRTVGKGNAQDQVILEVGHLGMMLTTSHFLRPSGKNLHRFPDSKDSDDWGVRPEQELECPVSADFSKALRRSWLLHSLRPGGSTERLPLDDPTADPQREAALAALRELAQPRRVGAR